MSVGFSIKFQKEKTNVGAWNLNERTPVSLFFIAENVLNNILQFADPTQEKWLHRKMKIRKDFRVNDINKTMQAWVVLWVCRWLFICFRQPQKQSMCHLLRNLGFMFSSVKFFEIHFGIQKMFLFSKKFCCTRQCQYWTNFCVWFVEDIFVSIFIA